MQKIEIGYDPHEVAPVEIEIELSELDKQCIESGYAILKEMINATAIKFNFTGNFNIKDNDLWKFENAEIEVGKHGAYINFYAKHTGFMIQTTCVNNNYM